MMAKLAARRKMKEELEKERAVAAELDRITKAQVNAFENVKNARFTQNLKYIL